MKESIYREQPEVTFKHEVLLILQGTSTVVGYSSFSNFNVFLGDRLRTVNIKVSDFFFMNEIIHIIKRGSRGAARVAKTLRRSV